MCSFWRIASQRWSINIPIHTDQHINIPNFRNYYLAENILAWCVHNARACRRILNRRNSILYADPFIKFQPLQSFTFIYSPTSWAEQAAAPTRFIVNHDKRMPLIDWTWAGIHIPNCLYNESVFVPICWKRARSIQWKIHFPRNHLRSS